MDRRQIITATTTLLFAGAAAPAASLAAAPPENWDGMNKVKSKRFRLAYLAPGVSFNGYTKVMVDPTEIAFDKNWRKDQNSTTRSPSRMISEADLRKIIDQGGPAATDIISKAFAKGGYPVVTAAGPDVLRVRTAVLNIDVNAPDISSPGRTRSYATEAGSATYVVEVRDSVSGSLMGRAVDSKIVGDSLVYLRNSVTNRADFSRAVQQWADDSVKALKGLQAEASGGTAK
jgi:hypothetical protein